jgi:hypothetical protein
MLEAVIFFEPYRAVLQVLQKFTKDTFPLLDYILGTQTDPTPPSYLSELFTYVLPNSEGSSLGIENLTVFSAWPSANKLGLDKRQHEALYTALTSRVALIQGPPGTGKTFLALRILQTLLANKSFWQGTNYGEQSAKSQIYTCGIISRRQSWHVKNKIFWENYLGDWRDDRAPVVVICFTVRYLMSICHGNVFLIFFNCLEPCPRSIFGRCPSFDR